METQCLAGVSCTHCGREYWETDDVPLPELPQECCDDCPGRELP